MQSSKGRRRCSQALTRIKNQMHLWRWNGCTNYWDKREFDDSTKLEKKNLTIEPTKERQKEDENELLKFKTLYTRPTNKFGIFHVTSGTISR